MAFVRVEDLAGQIECLVFPRMFEKYQPLLQEDEIVVIGGRLSVREEESPKLLAETITRIDEWKKKETTGGARAAGVNGAAGAAFAQKGQTDAQAAAASPRKLFLRLGRKDMDRVSAMLALDPGGIPVYMHIPDEKMTLLSPRNGWVAGSEEGMKRLREALGAENVVMK